MERLFDTGEDKRSARQRLPILFPAAFDQTYDYEAPAEMHVEAGAFVLAPLGGQLRLGVVWDEPVGRSAAPEKKLRTLAKHLSLPPLPPVSLRFAEWVARYTLAPLGMVVRLMTAAAAAEPEPLRLGVRIVPEACSGARLTPSRQQVLAVAADGLVRTKTALAAAAGCSPSVVEGLLATGFLCEAPLPRPGFARPLLPATPPPLAPEQAHAARALCAAVENAAFSVTLLDGVTGSGKTEVYFEAIARALEMKRQVLVLLPEISLTSQFLARFSARFGCPPAEWHSALSKTERARTWRAAATGEASAVAGARSALFLPFRDLGLIVIDEEHDASYKQDTGVHYQARDMAVVRARLGRCPIILASATPSLETVVNVQRGRYGRVALATRYSGTALARVETIDLRKTPPAPGRWLSEPLVAALAETLARGEQSLLFLNRRGYAPLTLCRTCGHRLECPQCTAWLVEHRARQRLGCHHCGFWMPIPARCPQCGAEGSLTACGPGVERVAEEVTARFPAARTAVLSSDLVPGVASLRALLKEIENGETGIIVGTQLVAKGHHFPKLVTVGVVDGDLGLSSSADPRAAERTFQLLSQVAGRAGRALSGGRAYIQTYDPSHPVMQAIAAGDRAGFEAQEIAIREAGMLPPFGRLAALIVSAPQGDLAEAYAREVARHAPPSGRIEVLGPAQAPLAVVRGRHRWRLLVRAPRELDLQAYLRTWLAAAPEPKGSLRLSTDVDPYNFL